MKKVILASKSPRRIELFAKYGINAESVPADIDETVPENLKTPSEVVKYLSRKKAEAVAESVSDESIIVAADTLVFCGGKILGKPRNTGEAREMLTLLSGNTHSVVSGICVICGEKKICESVTTEVVFEAISEEEIEAYIGTDEPYDKAGGYGIQSLGGAFVREIHGDYYNVVGLPVSRLLAVLKVQFGFAPFKELCRQKGAVK